MSKKESSAAVAELPETTTAKPFDFENFEFNTLEDFKIWNAHAHRAFREAKKANPKCNPPIPVRVPDASFHRHVKVKFQRFDQPENVLKVKRRTHEIDWEGQLKPGFVYDLPMPVVKFLNSLAVAQFAEVKVEEAGQTRTETRQVGEKSRFSCQFMDMV